jgi:hypothetical protein
LPNRYHYNSNTTNIFQLNHYYSLLLLVKLFNLNANNPLLFYYLNNDSARPLSNHYNRWLNDSYWINLIGYENLKFIKLNPTHQINNNFNLYDIVAQVKLDSSKYFNNQIKYSILSTSDVLVGPRLLSCFSNDFSIDDDNQLFNTQPIINTHSVRAKMTHECYNSLNKNKYFSFLYKIEAIHKENDFSGLFLWKHDNDDNDNDQLFIQELKQTHVTQYNNYKCHYKRDVVNADLNSLNSFENSFCVFGFEMNAYDVPKLEDIFFKKNNYLNSIIRKYIFNDSKIITYFNNIESITSKIIPNKVHLIWFADGPRPLKFIEYLCLKSILLVIRPDIIRVHGDNKPIGDYWNELNQLTNKIEWVQRERSLIKVSLKFNYKKVYIN